VSVSLLALASNCVDGICFVYQGLKVVEVMSKVQQAIAMPGSWKQKFQDSTFRTNFQLFLSQSMVEYLCACADNVRWDRSRFCSIHRPDNWGATEASLIKRGMCERKSCSEIEAERAELKKAMGDEYDWKLVSSCRLTPAGQAVVELFKVTGVFVAADGALIKEAQA